MCKTKPFDQPSLLRVKFSRPFFSSTTSYENSLLAGLLALNSLTLARTYLRRAYLNQIYLELAYLATTFFQLDFLHEITAQITIWTSSLLDFLAKLLSEAGFLSMKTLQEL